MRRGRPVSRGIAVVAGTTLLILRPMKHTAALRPAARPANPPADPFRSKYCNSGRRRGGVALASSPATVGMTATAGGGATTHIGSIKDCASGRRGAGLTTSATATLASRVSLGVQGGGLQKHAWRAAGRRPVAPLCMSQTSPPVFQPQQAGDRKDSSSSSPTAAGDNVVGKEDDHHSNGQGAADVRQQPAVVSLHQHHRHNHHPGARNVFESKTVRSIECVGRGAVEVGCRIRSGLPQLSWVQLSIKHPISGARAICFYNM